MSHASSEAKASYGEYLSLALELAMKAGDMISDAFLKAKHISAKTSSADVVTETDKNCEDLILSGIKAKYPNHKFIAEESHTGNDYDWTDTPTWLIDPVDGTTNFVHSFPFVCVSIGLAIKKEVVVGVVHNPIMKETFHAVKGQGAFLNWHRISVSPIRDITRSSLLTEFGYEREQPGVDNILQRLRQLLSMKIQAIRSMGSCALNMCYVAAGRVELYYEGRDENQGPKPWDMAAGHLIVHEAGGITLDTNGDELDFRRGRIMAANSVEMGRRLVEILKLK